MPITMIRPMKEGKGLCGAFAFPVQIRHPLAEVSQKLPPPLKEESAISAGAILL